VPTGIGPTDLAQGFGMTKRAAGEFELLATAFDPSWPFGVVAAIDVCRLGWFTTGSPTSSSSPAESSTRSPVIRRVPTTRESKDSPSGPGTHGRDGANCAEPCRYPNIAGSALSKVTSRRNPCSPVLAGRTRGLTFLPRFCSMSRRFLISCRPVALDSTLRAPTIGGAVRGGNLRCHSRGESEPESTVL
jgi:hypothetical protein